MSSIAALESQREISDVNLALESITLQITLFSRILTMKMRCPDFYYLISNIFAVVNHAIHASNNYNLSVRDTMWFK